LNELIDKNLPKIQAIISSYHIPTLPIGDTGKPKDDD